LIGSGSGLTAAPRFFFLDISNATFPFVTTSTPDNSQLGCVSFDISSNGIAMCVANLVFIYNFTNVNSPFAIGFVNVTQFPLFAQSSGESIPGGFITPDGKFVFLLSYAAKKIGMFNISDPMNPILVMSANFPGTSK